MDVVVTADGHLIGYNIFTVILDTPEIR